MSDKDFGKWKCDICGKPAGLHQVTHKDGDGRWVHQWFCWKCALEMEMQTRTSSTGGMVMVDWRNEQALKIQIRRAKGGYYLRIMSKNGRILAHSEVYSTLGNCKQAAERLSSAWFKIEEDVK